MNSKVTSLLDMCDIRSILANDERNDLCFYNLLNAICAERQCR